MPLIRCTQKLIAELGTPVFAHPSPADSPVLGDWYGTLFRHQGKKCVLFASAKTLLTLLIVDVARADIRNYQTLFHTGLHRLLVDEGFPPVVIERVLRDYETVGLATTNDRRLVGSLSELARMAEILIDYGGGIGQINLCDVNHKLNRVPMKYLRMADPLNSTRELLGGVAQVPLNPPGAERRRKSRPDRLKITEVCITRQEQTATLTPHDPDMASTDLVVGPGISHMTDEQILALYNHQIMLYRRAAERNPYVAVEIPRDQPQLRFHPENRQWTPRGGVLRCLINTDANLGTVVRIDDHELTMDELGELLAVYAGWGMRIEFTPDDKTGERPALRIGNP